MALVSASKLSELSPKSPWPQNGSDIFSEQKSQATVQGESVEVHGDLLLHARHHFHGICDVLESIFLDQANEASEVFLAMTLGAEQDANDIMPGPSKLLSFC